MLFRSVSTEPVVAGDATDLVAFDQAIHDLLPADIKDRGSIRIGITAEDAPFMTKNGTSFEGIIPDLSSHVSSVLGVAVEMEEMPFPGLIPALQANRIDYAWTSMFDTVKREEVLDFVSYVSASYGLVVPEDNPKGINSLDDLCGTTASTTKGTVMIPPLEAEQANCIESGKPSMEISLYDSASAALVQVRSGKVDAFFSTATPMRVIVAETDGGKAFDLADGTYPAGYIGIGSLKEKPELAVAMQTALQRVAEKGVYQTVLKDRKSVV